MNLLDMNLATPSNFCKIYIYTPDLTPQQQKEYASKKQISWVEQGWKFKKRADFLEREVKFSLHITSTNYHTEPVAIFDSVSCLLTNARSILNKLNELQLLVSQYNPYIIGIG